MHSDQLVSIVKSLSSREKADFKRYLNYKSGNRTPKHEILFNILNKYSAKNLEDDELTKQVKKALKSHPNILNDLANIRSQLKVRLLESLVFQQTEKSILYEIDQSIKSVKVLVQRKMFPIASSEIKMLKKKAICYDLNRQVADLIDLELFMVGYKSTNAGENELKKLITQQQYYIKLFQLEIELKNLFRTLELMAVKLTQVQAKTQQVALEEIGQHPTLQNLDISIYESQNNLHIVCWYHRIKDLYHRWIGEPQTSFHHSKKLIVFFESNKALTNKFLPKYIKALCSFGKSCSANKNYEELNEVVSKIKSLYDKKENYNAREALCDMGIIHYIETFQYDKAIEISELIDSTWDEIKAKTFDGKLLWYAHTNVLLYLIVGNNEKLHYWLNQGLNISRPKKARNHYLALRQLELIYLLINDDFLMLKEKIETYQKTLQYNNAINNFEKIVLKHLRCFFNIHNSAKNLNLSKVEKDEQVQQNFESLKKALLAMQSKVSPINFESILFWCESKLQHKSIRFVFENHYLEKLV